MAVSNEIITIKSFRGGISPDGYKGSRGAFSFGYGLDIHGGRDSLKCNQKLKKDTGSIIEEKINVILPTSDGNVYAFGESRGVYRKMSGTWTKVYTFNERRGPITGAIEYPTVDGPYIIIATELQPYQIRLERAAENDWANDTESVNDGGVTALFIPDATFKVTYDTDRYGLFVAGAIRPSGDAFPELIASGRVEDNATSDTLSLNLTIPANNGRMMVIIIGEKDGTGLYTGVTVNGSATGIQSEINGSGGGSFTERRRLLRLAAPPSGSVTVVASFSGSTHSKFMRVLVFDKAADDSVSRTSGTTGLVGGEEQLVQPFYRYETRFLSLITEGATHYGQGKLGTSSTLADRTDSIFIRDRQDEMVPHVASFGAGSVMFGNGASVAMFDYNRVFTKQALALPPGLSARAIKEQSTDTYNRIVIACDEPGMERGWVVTWDGASDTWLSKKRAKVSTVGAIEFLESGMVLQGEGQFRYWNFVESVPMRAVPGTESSALNGACEYRTIPHFGLNGGDKCGVYSVGRIDKNDPIAVNLEYVPSHGQFEDVEITAIASAGDDLYVAWSATISEVLTYGIDVIDHDNKAVARYESLTLDMGRPEIEKLVTQIKCLLAEALPADTNVAVQYRSTRSNGWVNAGMSNGATTINTTGVRKGIFNAEAHGEEYEVAITITPDDNNTPEVSAIANFFKTTNQF